MHLQMCIFGEDGKPKEAAVLLNSTAVHAVAEEKCWLEITPNGGIVSPRKTRVAVFGTGSTRWPMMDLGDGKIRIRVLVEYPGQLLWIASMPARPREIGDPMFVRQHVSGTYEFLGDAALASVSFTTIVCEPMLMFGIHLIGL
jgi:hypothetical protein